MNPRHLTPGDLGGRRWRGLIRESTAEQTRKEATPERQRVDLRRAASELGMVPVEPLFYERTGSGEDEDVPELAQALRDARAGQYDVLVVFHTSRFARNRAEAVAMKREFRKAGIVIYFVAQRIISGAFTAALSEGISEVLDEHENEQRRLWIAGGLRERQKSGRWHGQIPFGYRRALVDFPDGTRGWDGGLEPDPALAATVRGMFDQIILGGSLRDVAFRLNATGSRTGRGLPWSSRGVHAVIANPVYLGHLVRYRRTSPSILAEYYYAADDPQDGHADLGVRFPALIDEEVWRSANEQMARRAWGGGPYQARPYPLSGILRCASCGYTMTGAWGTTRRYYRCRGRASAKTCNAPSIRADVAEAQFADWLSSYQLPDDWRDAIARTRPQAVRHEEGDRQRRLKERLDRTRNLYTWGHIPEAEYRAEERAIRSEMAVVEMPTTGSLEDVAAALATLGSAWRTAPPGIQAAVPPLMLHAGEVGPDGIEWVVRAELRPLLELCVPSDASAYSRDRGYTARYSA